MECATAKTTTEMTGPDALTNMTLGDAFRTTAESYPILKAFDTKINSVSFVDGITNYEFNSGEVVEPLKIKLNLSNTLNQQNQNDKVALYLDDETTIDCGNFSGNDTNSETINITGDNLDKIKNLSVGKYKIEALITK